MGTGSGGPRECECRERMVGLIGWGWAMRQGTGPGGLGQDRGVPVGEAGRGDPVRGAHRGLRLSSPGNPAAAAAPSPAWEPRGAETDRLWPCSDDSHCRWLSGAHVALLLGRAALPGAGGKALGAQQASAASRGHSRGWGSQSGGERKRRPRRPHPRVLTAAQAAWDHRDEGQWVPRATFSGFPKHNGTGTLQHLP